MRRSCWVSAPLTNLKRACKTGFLNLPRKTVVVRREGTPECSWRLVMNQLRANSIQTETIFLITRPQYWISVHSNLENNLGLEHKGIWFLILIIWKIALGKFLRYPACQPPPSQDSRLAKQLQLSILICSSDLERYKPSRNLKLEIFSVQIKEKIIYSLSVDAAVESTDNTHDSAPAPTLLQLSQTLHEN